jgi:hypothetical protein
LVVLVVPSSFNFNRHQGPGQPLIKKPPQLYPIAKEPEHGWRHNNYHNYTAFH